MDRSKKKRGISLSHQMTHGQSPPYTVISSNVRQVSFKPSLTSTSTPKDLRYSLQVKPKVVFNYSINQTEKRGSACNYDFSFSNLTSRTPQNRLSFFKITPVNHEGVNNRSGQHFSKSKERFILISATRKSGGHHTQKRSYLLTNENGMNQNRESLRQVYKRQEYDKMLGQRNRDTQNSGLYGTNDQGQHYPNTSSFSKIQIPQAVKSHRKKPISTVRESLRPSKQDLQSLKELQKRLIQIISV